MRKNIFNRIRCLFSKDKVLVLSGWWFRWFYTIWVLKWLEELGIDKDIKAVFWVSIWAIVWSLRAWWTKADEIYDLLSSMTLGKFYSNDIFKKTWWLLSNKKIEELIQQHIKKSFSDLDKKMYVGVVDTNTATYHLFDNWDLQKIVLGSMSIPWVFPPVKYKNYCFVDGWVLNNFPVDLAKNKYPYAKTIWIALNRFEKNQEIKTVKDNLLLNFEVILRSKLLENTKKVDTLFYREIPIWVLSLDKEKMEKAYDMGYKDCMKKFK